MGQLKDLEIEATTYHLHGFSAIINVRTGALGTIQVCGRVPWRSAFSGMFGLYFKNSLRVSQAFIQALGCAARVFEAVMDAEPPKFDGPPATFCCSYFSSSYGKGSVGFACQTFPELNMLRWGMDYSVKKSTEEAFTAYDSSLVCIAGSCECKVCKGKCDDKTKGGQFCLVLIVETILAVTGSLCGISVAKDQILCSLVFKFLRTAGS